MYLEYDKINIDNMMIFKCHGELDIYHSLDFKEEIKKEIKDDYFDILVLDFSDIRHIDSSGIGSLVSVFKFINENRKKMYMTGLNKDVKNIMNITNASKLIKIFDTLEDIIKPGGKHDY
ncbi:MAG: STAS domain-containing protein [Thermotogae bacterium]|nr:STAS domain-containing protein [Thermotogota bacterium]MCP5465844.1 STAS domain-containing protein [Thermotogota bacterium]HOO73913.1 STAS domain-containing protein [Tepiditoga sp.]